MKKILFSVIAFLGSLTLFAQNISGDWQGILKVPGGQLRLVIHITGEGDGYSATMDSPDQNAKGFPVSSISCKDSVLTFSISNIGASYTGKLGKDHVFVGTFSQGGQPFPLDLTRGSAEKDKPRRPQTPFPPFPYLSEQVRFDNKTAGNSLAGTLTIPKGEGKFPAVILISGSGAQNRDEEIFEHKPFLVLADHLTQNGIAVLRYDDRGVGASTGDISLATSKDFASDVRAALAYLQTRKEINTDKIGLIGHSEGGLIAPMLASKSRDIAFIVLLAGPGLPGDELLLLQSRVMGKTAGVGTEQLESAGKLYRKAYDIVKQNQEPEPGKAPLKVHFEEFFFHSKQFADASQKAAYINQQVILLTSPWMNFFIQYDPVPALENVKCPVLALNGEKDVQVPPKENLPAIKTALLKAGNKDFEVKELPGLNHLFQEAGTGLPSEYGIIEQTFSPIALKEITSWITIHTR
ncbi:hypothetical protein DYBT9275_05230 [Dyadobacter sp. CECT 9275]|uniref:Serine aminopeptidase S33 domain-containing protein n=1 Tax=Dyadobacter helix TaxID=2822344 RepID=A0A916JH83_9BACT|nr:alpha/beta hydrolase [Dyadobacter sp. CECT 9275]CAG5012702.1 hypothetical protein DYBT9275_05230 [Dyadobacter sp. CECT 9275]